MTPAQYDEKFTTNLMPTGAASGVQDGAKIL